MATRYTLTHQGSEKLPISSDDVTYSSPGMGNNSATTDVYIEFYDEDGTSVTPTGGKVHVYGLPMGENWLQAAGSPVDATLCSTPVSTYTPPNMYGLCTRANVRFLGVTGADHARVVMFKREAL